MSRVGDDGLAEELVAVEEWRLEQIVAFRDRWGDQLDLLTARRIAAEFEIDIRRLEDALDNGCPISVAVDIFT